MEDLFKKLVYTSVGLVSMTIEKLQDQIGQLVDEDKLSQAEGKKIVDDLVKNTEAKREAFEAQLKKVVEEVLTKMNLATASQLKDLQERLATVEAKVGTQPKAASEEESSENAS